VSDDDLVELGFTRTADGTLIALADTRATAVRSTPALLTATPLQSANGGHFLPPGFPGKPLGKPRGSQSECVGPEPAARLSADGHPTQQRTNRLAQIVVPRAADWHRFPAAQVWWPQRLSFWPQHLARDAGNRLGVHQLDALAHAELRASGYSLRCQKGHPLAAFFRGSG